MPSSKEIVLENKAVKKYSKKILLAMVSLSVLTVTGCSFAKCGGDTGQESEEIKSIVTVPVAEQGLNVVQGVITPGVSPCMNPDAPKNCVFEAPSVGVKLYVAEPTLEGRCKVLGEVVFDAEKKGATVQIPTPSGKICLFEQKNFECIQEKDVACVEIKGDCGVLPVEFFVSEYSGCLDVADAKWTTHTVQRAYP